MIEIQVAINFLVSFLYNKLPRRRVNQFAEELENIVKCKFDGHWYPDEPYKGSAYRCIHCNPQLDSTLFREAARNSGLNLKDVQDNLPNELSIWIDPGEVSYRISEKGPVNILYSSKTDSNHQQNPNHKSDLQPITSSLNGSLNPEAQCFQPSAITSANNNIVDHHHQHHNGSLSPPTLLLDGHHHHPKQLLINHQIEPNSTLPTTGATAALFIHPKHDPTVTLMTTAAFAATKFGSTKPKVQSMNKNKQQYQHQLNRTSPTESAQQTAHQKSFFTNNPANRKPLVIHQQQPYAHTANGMVKSSKYNNHKSNDLLVNYANIHNNNNAKQTWTNGSLGKASLYGLNQHYQPQPQQAALDTMLMKTTPAIQTLNNDLYLVNNLMMAPTATTTPAVAATIAINGEQQQQTNYKQRNMSGLNGGSFTMNHYPSPSLSPFGGVHHVVGGGEHPTTKSSPTPSPAIYFPSNGTPDLVSPSQTATSTPPPALTLPTGNVADETTTNGTIPCFMPNQLLREIFDITANNDNGNHHLDDFYQNGQFENNGHNSDHNGGLDDLSPSPWSSFNELLLMANNNNNNNNGDDDGADLATNTAVGGQAELVNNVTSNVEVACSPPSSSSSSMMNHMMMMMINNDFDNLSINSTNSSNSTGSNSLASVSSYPT